MLWVGLHTRTHRNLEPNVGRTPGVHPLEDCPVRGTFSAAQSEDFPKWSPRPPRLEHRRVSLTIRSLPGSGGAHPRPVVTGFEKVLGGSGCTLALKGLGGVRVHPLAARPVVPVLKFHGGGSGGNPPPGRLRPVLKGPGPGQVTKLSARSSTWLKQAVVLCLEHTTGLRLVSQQGLPTHMSPQSVW